MQPKISWRLRGDVDGETERRAILDGPGPFTIGRHDDNGIVLEHEQVSRWHAEIYVEGEQVTLVDSDSANGSFLDGVEVTEDTWHPGQELSIGPYVFQLTITGKRRMKTRRSPAHTPRQDFPPAFFNSPVVSAEQIAGTGLLEAEVDYLAVGGGLGSFSWVDHLRIFGVPSDRIRVVGLRPSPYDKYAQLCRNSQIPLHERLRSNSLSAPDNIWGFPGYASRETWQQLKSFRLGGLKHILTVFGEPALAVSYTPTAGQVFESIDKEAARIGWDEMMLTGTIRKIRKTEDGRYAVAYRLPKSAVPKGGERGRFVIGRFIHLATGYPGSRFLPDLQDFKAQVASSNVVNAYESHDEIYTALGRSGGTVVVRGRGIVASRVIQRISEERKKNPNIRVLHVMRSRVKRGKKYDLARRFVSQDVELQPFNWPKACWGGTLRKRLEKATPEERTALMRQWGGTTTAERADWQQILADGLREEWYRPFFGTVTALKQSSKSGRKIAMMLESAEDEWGKSELEADYVIDCTGLIADLRASNLLDDLLDTYKLERNEISGQDSERSLSGLAVSNSFEVEGLGNGNGRSYAAGVLTANGPYAAVDSFLGLQYAALRSVDHLRSVGAPHVSRFGALKSFGQWLKWCMGAKP